tara:strand:+ start:15668 stop:16024 length:357 start_codon:yes stop_codon:yes gene_type:complete
LDNGYINAESIGVVGPTAFAADGVKHDHATTSTSLFERESSAVRFGFNLLKEPIKMKPRFGRSWRIRSNITPDRNYLTTTQPHTRPKLLAEKWDTAECFRFINIFAIHLFACWRCCAE